MNADTVLADDFDLDASILSGDDQAKRAVLDVLTAGKASLRATMDKGLSPQEFGPAEKVLGAYDAALKVVETAEPAK